MAKRTQTQTPSVADRLAAAGIAPLATSDQLTGKEDLSVFEPQPPTPGVASVKRPEPTAEQALAKVRQAFGDHILAVTDLGPKGARRIAIACTDPQQVRGESICTGEREIAVQDAFQVRRCEACQARLVRKNRAAKRKAKAKAAKAAAKA